MTLAYRNGALKLYIFFFNVDTTLIFVIGEQPCIKSRQPEVAVFFEVLLIALLTLTDCELVS